MSLFISSFAIGSQMADLRLAFLLKDKPLNCGNHQGSDQKPKWRSPVTNTSHRVLQLTLSIVVLMVCGWSRCGSGTPVEYKELFNLPPDQQEQRFKQFPLEEQVDIYIPAMYVEPPLTRYANYIGSNGKDILPFLLARLEREKSDTGKACLFYALTVMHEHYFSLRNESSTLKSLEYVGTNMSDQYRKNQCQHYLKAIRESPGFDR